MSIIICTIHQLLEFSKGIKEVNVEGHVASMGRSAMHTKF